MYRSVSLVAIALLLGIPAYAQDRTTQIDSIFSWATPATPGCAVGVSHQGRVVVSRAYGLADVERRIPLSPSSVFDIGSTQKQFVAAAVLLLVDDGRLALSDDIRKYVPELPDYGQKITLDQLLNHTSGIRDWTGILPIAEGDPDVLTVILRQRGLNFVPGEEWSYSNSGYVLLKEIVARASGMSFAQFARTRLFEPLGMTSSAYVAEMREGSGNVVPAYEKDGTGWRKEMLLGNARGGGALLSTAGDLLIWNDALTNARLGRFVSEKMQEPATLNSGRKLSYARGLMLDTNYAGRLIWHSGSAAAYKSILARFVDQGMSIAVLCNAGEAADDRDGFAARVFDLFMADRGLRRPEPSAPPALAAAAGVDVRSRAGLFFKESTGEPLRLVVNDGRLRIAGGPILVTVTSDHFRNPRGTLSFMSQDAFELHFLSEDQLELRSMEGRTTRYRRALPYAPTAADLQAFDGRYESDEIGSVFEILPGNNALVMRVESSPDQALEIRPVDRDTYQISRMTVRFLRDASGKVVAFDYSNPVVRNIRFTRLGDRTASASPAAPVSAPAAAAPAGAAAPAMRLEGLVGEYEVAPGRTLAITLEDGRLHGQPPGGGKRSLTHVSGTTFSAADSGVTLTFTLGADGRATSVVMRQNGRERILPKVR